MNMKQLCAMLCLAFLMSTEAFALRCNGNFITNGSTYADVKECDGITYEYQVRNVMADQRMVYLKQYGMTYKIKLIDGQVVDINQYRVR